VAAVRNETTIAPADRETILEHRPGLKPWFDAVDQKQAAVDGLVYGEPLRLTLALDHYAQLTPEDLLPRKERNEDFVYTPLGAISPVIWDLYRALGNIRTMADVDEATVHLRTAFRELNERLETQAVLGMRQRQAPVMVTTPQGDPEPPASITNFGVFAKD